MIFFATSFRRITLAKAEVGLKHFFSLVLRLFRRACIRDISGGANGALAPGSALARPSAQPLRNTSGNFFNACIFEGGGKGGPNYSTLSNLLPN